MSVESRRKVHQAINSLSHKTVADIVQKHFPRLTPSKVDAAAKLVISKAHDIVSPKGK